MNLLVSTQVIFQFVDFWNIAPYNLIGGHKISRETCFLSLRNRRKETTTFDTS